MSHDIDVLVCGGGCAGLGAAVAAARAGAKVLLIERAGFAGGIISAVGLPFMDGLACWHTNRIVVRGLALDLLVRMGCAPKDARRLEDLPKGRAMLGHGTALVPNIEHFKVAADEAVAEAGVRVLYHTLACGVEVHGGRIATVTIANKDGLTRLAPRVVIDCTGDADIAQWSGCPMEPIGERMPMTLHFRIGNMKYLPETRAKAAEVVKQAHADGRLPHYYGPGFGPNFAPDEAYVHAVRVPGNAVDAADLTRAEIQGRRDAWTMFQLWKQHVPGFEDSYYIGSGPYIGVRETRRISGRHVLCEDDLRQTRRFDDAIATGSWYTDIHPNYATAGGANVETKGEKFVPRPYDIPYGSILPRGVDNLLVAGRCHAATRVAASSTRVTVTAMALGEAAGAAAAIAAKEGKVPAELSGITVRERLAAAGGGPFTDG
jgi:hypothetical protein